MTTHAHPPIHPYHNDIYIEPPPSPTLTNPDMILPLFGSTSPNQNLRFSPQSMHSSPSQLSTDTTEVGVATAVAMPVRITTGVPTVTSFHRYYESGPLSDIHEEETTPKKPKMSRSRSPSRPFSPINRNRLSNRSSSSMGSDVGDWEQYDTTKMMSSRLAADVANGEDDVDLDGLDSKRNSGTKTNVESELALLDERAEKILENARKRLTHMEDNLSKARHSILSPSKSSSNLKEPHKPVGGLYRSISLAGNTRGKRTFPRREAHARNASDTSTNGLKRLSIVSDNRSVSAMEYGRRQEIGGLSPNSPHTRIFGSSPASTKSYTSPLRTFQEDEASPSTAITSIGTPRGLGINTFAAISKEDISSSPLGHVRSSSQTSTRSTRELREQMSDLRTRIEDLKMKAQADRPYRPSSRELSSPVDVSPTQDDKPERTQTPKGIKTFLLDRPETRDRATTTPHSQRFPIDPTTPGTGPFTDARTDRNTPSLHKKVDVVPFRNPEMIMAESLYEDANQQFEEEENPIAASEEEQIYLNEVLQESLQEVESDTELPDQYLDVDMAAERHEDRLDAFDYENMILHSALGTYSGRSTEPISDSESDASSIATKRALQESPNEEEEVEEVDEPTTEPGQFDDAEEEDQDYTDKTPTKVVADLPLLAPPKKPWMKLGRSDSMDSTSTIATFATATEGQQDESPNEILHWGTGTGFPYPPTTSPPKRDFTNAWPAPPVGVRPHHTRASSRQTLPTIYDNGIPTPPSQSPNQTQPISKRFDEVTAMDRPANTEVLMESLIKLVDPDFKVEEGNGFADVDKELVLHLLRAVGGVCDGVFRAQERGEVRATKVMRRRLDAARKILEGEEI